MCDCDNGWKSVAAIDASDFGECNDGEDLRKEMFDVWEEVDAIFEKRRQSMTEDEERKFHESLQNTGDAKIGRRQSCRIIFESTAVLERR